jgi:hypothetical protein
VNYINSPLAITRVEPDETILYSIRSMLFLAGATGIEPTTILLGPVKYAELSAFMLAHLKIATAPCQTYQWAVDGIPAREGAQPGITIL